MTETPGSHSPISHPELTRLLGVIREHRSGAPARAPLIIQVAHPGLRREVPDVVLQAVQRARSAAAAPASASGSESGPQAVPPVTPARPLIVPQNLSAVLGLARPTH